MNYLRGYYGTWIKENFLVRPTVSAFTRQSMFAIGGLSLFVVALSEYRRQALIRTIALRKKRLDMVRDL